jgi:hypothetical protein
MAFPLKMSAARLGSAQMRRQRTQTQSYMIAGVLGRECHVSFWHFTAVHDVCSNVGNWRISGPVMLTLSFVDPDPFRHFATGNCRGAKGFSPQ